MSPLVSRTPGVEESLADSSKRANAAVVLLVVLGEDGVKGVCLELEELKGGVDLNRVFEREEPVSVSPSKKV